MKRLLTLLLIPTLLLAQKQPKIGLVLSGGGAKGFAHVGVLKEIEKAGLQIDYIGGTSMGAIVGGLFAAGYSSDQIEEFIIKTDFTTLLQDEVDRDHKSFFMKQYGEKYALTLPISDGNIGLPLGLSKGQNVLNYFTELLEPVEGIEDFSKLPIPFYCMATDIETGEEIVLDKGSLPLALRTSGSFPTLLNPVEVNGKLLVDGGVVNNFPVNIMKTKDVDIIIGVNVQGQLLDKEKISSVSSLLIQIINFNMYEKSDEQAKYLDISLRPNIFDYSAMSFDKKEEILSEGKIAAKRYKTVFDSLAKKQKNKKERIPIKLEDKNFLVDRIIINGNEHYTDSYVLGKLQLEENDSVSYKEISKKINGLTATKNFDRVDYKFDTSFQGKKLELTLKEGMSNAFLRFGVHYDLLYKTAVLLNYNDKKILKQNDELTFDLGIGDRIRYELNYFIDNGLIPSYGVSSRYNNFRGKFLFDEKLSPNEINIRYYDFSNALYVQTTLDKKFAFGLGIENKKIRIITDDNALSTNGEEIIIDNSNYINGFSFLKLDAYNKKNYPTDGYFADFGFKWFIWSDRNTRRSEFKQGASTFEQFSQLQGTLGFAKTFFNDLTFQYTSSAGYTLGEISSDIFDFRLGGYNKNFINNFVTMYGYETSSLNNQSFLKSEFILRKKVFDRHYVTGIANYARVEDDIFAEGKLFDNIKSGYALGYGIETFLGPIEIKYSWSPDHSERFWLFNLGFWF